MNITAIADMPVIERPREKMLRYGPGKLTETELLSIIIGTGTRNMGVMALAGSIINHFGKAGLPVAGCADLSIYNGTGPARACRIAAIFELGRRFLQAKKNSIYLKPEDIWVQMRDIRDAKKEHFVTFYLDTRNQEIKREIISIGTLNLSLVHPREVFEPAVKNLAAGIIVAHNHPSGCPDPSEEDISSTRRLVQAGKLLGINLIDHIIVCRDTFSSMKEKGFI
ncbi:MAG: DNA repair protein RadC [Elusimicrobiales bacterium]|nr:DNA repair protein RadC [Elusimicrobiales bacterium]